MASSSEREIRDAVVDYFHRIAPKCRVVHELNVGQGTNRADIAVVFEDRLVLVEIKSEKDVLTRLERQFNAFRIHAHEVLIVAHESKFEGDRLKGCEWMNWAHREILWKYPSDDWFYDRYRDVGEPRAMAFLDLLWKDELLDECYRAGLNCGAKSRRWELCRDLALRLTGRQIREAVCRQLRAREFAEADPAIAVELILVTGGAS